MYSIEAVETGKDANEAGEGAGRAATGPAAVQTGDRVASMQRGCFAAEPGREQKEPGGDWGVQLVEGTRQDSARHVEDGPKHWESVDEVQWESEHTSSSEHFKGNGCVIAGVIVGVLIQEHI